MKAKRVIASLLSIAMTIGLLPGLVSAAVEYNIRVHEGVIVNSMDYPGPYHSGDRVGIIVEGGRPQFDGASFRFSYYNSDGGVDSEQITLDNNGMGYFLIMQNTYAGSDSSKYTIDVSAYYPVDIANHDHCDTVDVRYFDMINGQTLITSQLCPGGATTRVYADPSDGYTVDAVTYEYTFDGICYTEAAELKTDDSGSYFEFTMPTAPVSLSVHSVEAGHRYTWYVVTGNVEHAERFDVTGNDVNIILEDGASLDAQRGIAVNYRTDYTNTLNIWGQSNDRGVLNAIGVGDGEAGIGGNNWCSCGTVNIYGGTVNAYGANDGAGIGTGHLAYGWTDYVCAAINIYGGNIYAKGGYKAAGIGSGSTTERDEFNSISIYIGGGNVRAESGVGNVNGAIGYGYSDYYIVCDIVLDCTGSRDISVYADSYSVKRYDQTMTLNGTFVDEYGQTHTGNITSSNVSSINGRTLVRAGTIPVFTGHSLTLGGDIGVNYFVDMSMLTDAERQSATVDFTVNGVTTTDTFDPNFTNDNGDYGFTLNISSVQMADTITAVLHIGDRTFYANDYKVEDYYDQIIAAPGAYGTDVVNLVKALKDYGHYVQPFLSEHTRTPWTIGTDHMAITQSNTYDDSVLQPVYDIINNDSAIYVPAVSSHEGVSLTYSLNLETTTSVRLYLDPGSAGFEGPISLTVDGQSADYVLLSDGRYRVDIDNIPARLLGTGHNICFSYGNQSITVSNLSALSYVRLVMDLSNDFYNDTESQYAMCALYRYFQAAQNVQ